MRAPLAALGVLLAPGAASAEPFSLASPTEGQWGRLVLAVVDHGRARPTGGSYCPPPEGPDEICLGASIVQGSAEIVRYLSPRPEGWRYPGRFPQVRFIGGHAVRWVDAGVRLEILEQTAENYLWRVWSVPAGDDLVCLPRDLIARFRIRTSIRYRSRAGQENCFRLSDME
jgi:predicted DNA-binding transcriptional regulator AlpA